MLLNYNGKDRIRFTCNCDRLVLVNTIGTEGVRFACNCDAHSLCRSTFTKKKTTFPLVFTTVWFPSMVMLPKAHSLMHSNNSISIQIHPKLGKLSRFIKLQYSWQWNMNITGQHCSPHISNCLHLYSKLVGGDHAPGPWKDNYNSWAMLKRPLSQVLISKSKLKWVFGCAGSGVDNLTLL